LRKNQHKCSVLIFFIFLSFLFGGILISFNLQDQKLNYEKKEDFINPEVAAAPPIPLPYSAIDRNVTEIYRLFESIKITIDTTVFSEANYTQMQISFTNGSESNYNMISDGSNSFYYEYTPKYNAPLGFQNVSFLIYNVTDTLLNTHTTYTNFTIKTNYMANFNNVEYNIGDTLYAELSINNFGPYVFQWNITIVDNVNELTQTNLLNLEDDAFQITLTLSNEIFPQIEKIYFIKVNMTSSGKKWATYFPFEIREAENKPPEIHSYEINGESMNQSISVPYGRNLVFTFDVSDDDRVAYIKIALLDENDDWYNITKIYKDTSNFNITIRTAELITGTWYVYIYAIDSDGAISNYNSDYSLAPQGIKIIPEVLSVYMPWIVLIVGFALGVLAGVGSIYKYFKSKFSESKRITPKKKELPQRKPTAKKKAKIKPIKEELEKKEIPELVPGKQEEKERAPKRKIKRKI